MKPLTDKRLLESLGHRPRSGKVFKCSICGESFYRKPSHCVPPPAYCSVKCYGIGQQNRVSLICYYCGKEYSRPASHAKWNKIRGRKHNFCSVSCGATFWTPKGENHPNWSGGISREYQYGYHSAEYKNWHNGVFERDDYTCQACLERAGYRYEYPECSVNANQIHAHHFYSRRIVPMRYSLDNAIALCATHHTLGSYSAHLDPDFKDIIIERGVRTQEWHDDLIKQKQQITKNNAAFKLECHQKLLPWL
ncbi:hypothetical protein ES708_00716 [subsurface metagenome]